MYPLILALTLCGSTCAELQQQLTAAQNTMYQAEVTAQKYSTQYQYELNRFNQLVIAGAPDAILQSRWRIVAQLYAISTAASTYLGACRTQVVMIMTQIRIQQCP